jgi:hypothetical protein
MEKKKTRIVGMLLMVSAFWIVSDSFGQSGNSPGITVSTDFVSGGGVVKVICSNPAIIRFSPHDQGEGGWGKMWYYFMVDGLTAGEQIILEFDDEPTNVGISPQIFFSYDQEVWGLTNTGEATKIKGRDFIVYKHTVKGNKIWFAYDLPYTPEDMEKLLISEAEKDSGVEVFEMCKTKGNRSVKGLRFNDTDKNAGEKYGIWLQARTHAFESGSSWVLHELARWLLSNDPAAKALRSRSLITVIPIVDVDGVVEGRTGKNQFPYDHNRGWAEEPGNWIETQTTKSLITDISKQNKFDLFLDFHGPGNLRHPYFIIPLSSDLPFEKQRQNRAKFLEILSSKPLDNEAQRSQSMTKIYYSERPWDHTINSSRDWVIMNSTDHVVTLTLEVNMNTPLSTNDGYRAEAIVLGRALSEYFTNDYHLK